MRRFIVLVNGFCPILLSGTSLSEALKKLGEHFPTDDIKRIVEGDVRLRLDTAYELKESEAISITAKDLEAVLAQYTSPIKT